VLRSKNEVSVFISECGDAKIVNKYQPSAKLPKIEVELVLMLGKNVDSVILTLRLNQI
jgi:hypothetical protein